MARCKTCGEDTFIGNKRICNGCLKKWTDMRSAIFTKLQDTYGVLSPTNHQLFIKEMKRLEKIWKKDEVLFKIELEKIKIPTE